jgi:hypothetical protein
LCSVEFDCLTVLKVPVPVTLDVGEMDEKVLPTIIGRDESVTLLLTEPLDTTLSHSLILFLFLFFNYSRHTDAFPPGTRGHPTIIVRRDAENLAEFRYYWVE